MIFQPPKPVSLALNLAPMVDVMMCLIIFFMLAGKIVEQERRPLSLPFAVAAEALDTSRLGSRVVINVRPGTEKDSAEYVVLGWDGQNITERILAADEVLTYLQAQAAVAAERHEETRCVIRADREIHYKQIETVLRACGLAKIKDVIFGANAGEAPQEPT